MRPALVVHGGAWLIPDDEVDAHRHAVTLGLDAGWRALERGACAVDICIAAIAAMEDAPDINAGRGAVLNADGVAELDAALMDGTTLGVGAVAAVTRSANPITWAKLVLDSPHALLVGAGAERYVEARGLPLCDPAQLVTERERRRLAALRLAPSDDVRGAYRANTPADTVGAVAVDQRGGIAAATSTGGIPNKPAGRVGDSPMFGAGLYADVETAACSATGWGESIIRVGLARAACGNVGAGLIPREAAGAAVRTLADRVGGLGGCILLDRQGRLGVAFNTDRMAYAYRVGDGGPKQIAVGPRGSRSVMEIGVD